MIIVFLKGFFGVAILQDLMKYFVNMCFFRNVLELGSGLGFLGVALCKQCKLDSFTFSDFHPQVLFLLMKNIEINFLNEQYSLECPTFLENSECKDRKMLKKIKRQLSVSKELVMEDSCEIMQISFNSMVSSTDTMEREVDEQEVGSEQEEEVSNSNDHFLSSNSHWSPLNNSNVYTLNHSDSIRLMKFNWEFCNQKDLCEIQPDVILAAGKGNNSEFTNSICTLLLKGKIQSSIHMVLETLKNHN